MQTRWRQRRRARGRLAMPEAAERVVHALIDGRSSGQPDVVLARDVSNQEVMVFGVPLH